MQADLIASAAAVFVVAVAAFTISAAVGLTLDRWALRPRRGSLARPPSARRRSLRRPWATHPATPEATPER